MIESFVHSAILSWLVTSRRLLRAGLLAFSFFFVISDLNAAPCAISRAGQDEWVAARVNLLVRAAHLAFEEADEEGPAQRRYDRTVDDLADQIGRCHLNEDSSFAARYPEFLEFVRLLSLARKEDHELGFEVSDKKYFDETSKYTSIPEFLLTPRFLRAVSRFETLPDAKKLLRELNASRSDDARLIFFSYTSRHLGTPDNPNSFRRLLIVVPGDAAKGVPEKWVQFGVTDPRARARVRNVSVVAVLPGADQTANTYFKDYFRTYRRDGSITVSGRWELGYGDDNCVQCHKSGVLPIFPDDHSVSRAEEPDLQAVNQLFRSYGSPRFGGYLDASKFGPGLGSSGAECASCHHPNGLGSLNWPMDPVLIGSFVKDGEMPLGADLQSRERAKLYQHLILDYFAIDKTRPGILQSWLLGQTPPR